MGQAGSDMKKKTYVERAKARAAELGIVIYEAPKDSIKKFYTYFEGKKIMFGDSRFDDYLIHQNEARRQLFHQRFRNSPFYNDRRSPLFYSQKILW